MDGTLRMVGLRDLMTEITVSGRVASGKVRAPRDTVIARLGRKGFDEDAVTASLQQYTSMGYIRVTNGDLEIG
jgi:hypothetical protein